MNKNTSTVKIFFIIVLYSISLFFGIFALLLPINEYEWMNDFDYHSLPESSGNNLFFINICFIIVIFIQGVLCLLYKNKGKVLSLVIILITVIMYILRIL